MTHVEVPLFLVGKFVSVTYMLGLALKCQQLSCALLLLLVVAAGGNFVVEQPSSSLLFRHPRMVWLAKRLKVHGSNYKHVCMHDRSIFG